MKKPIVLLHIEDSEEIREHAEEFFNRQINIEYNGADHGLHALELISKGLQPHIIICDGQMPIMDGRKFIKEFRKTDKNTPIIANSSVYNAELIEAGATDHYNQKLYLEGYADRWIQIIKTYTGEQNE